MSCRHPESLFDEARDETIPKYSIHNKYSLTQFVDRHILGYLWIDIWLKPTDLVKIPFVDEYP